jgi:hypothetical protein
VRVVPRLCEFYFGICLTTEEKHGKNISQGEKTLSQVKKNFEVQWENLKVQYYTELAFLYRFMATSN